MLTPALPDGTEIVTNQTEYSDGAGGAGARVLVLRSRLPTHELELQIEAAFDADPAWHAEGEGPHKHWRRGESCKEQAVRLNQPTGESTTGYVRLAEAGEDILIAQFDEAHVDSPSVVVEISTNYHQFCNAGSVPR